MTKLQTKANERITSNVKQYRESHANLKALGPDAGNSTANAVRAYAMQMDRAAGALDALHELFPKLPAWAETKWIH